MPTVIAGLVLRPQSIEVFEAQGGFGRSKVSKIACRPLSDGEQVAETIKVALSQAGITAKHLAVSVPAQDVLLRSFSMPILPKPEWSTAVQFEARKYIPFKTDELAWTFHIAEDRAAKHLHVAFLAIRDETLTKIHGWLEAAGVKGAFVEAQAVSLARTVSMPAKAPQHHFVGVVDVDIEASMAHIVITRNHIPYFAREVHLVLGREGQEASSADIDARAEVLLSELRLSFDFFTRENPQATIQQLVLFGDHLTVSPWVRWLTEQLSCPVVMGELSLEHGQGDVVNLRYGCAVGLALRQLRPSPVKLDFVARSSSKALEGKASKALSLSSTLSPTLLKAIGKAAVAQGLAMVALIGALSVPANQPVIKARQELQRTIASFSDVGWGLTEKSVTELEALQQQADRRLAVLRELYDERILVTDKLEALAQELPDGIWLSGVSYQHRLNLERPGQGEQRLTIHGACFRPGEGDELEVIGQFAETLKRNRRFFRGLGVGQLGEVTAQETAQQLSYRTFQLNYQAERSL